MSHPALDLTLINVGGPCKLTLGSTVIYTEGNVQLEPTFNNRAIPSAVTGDHDDVTVDLTWKIRFTPKSVWSSDYRAALIPSAYYSATLAGTRLIGATTKNLTVTGSDGEQFIFARAAITRLPELYLGLGASLWGEVEMTAFIGDGKTPDEEEAFFQYDTGITWSQSDFPTAHQEGLCKLAWGAVTGWTSVFSEDGFRLTHELKLEPVKQGNITVDMKIMSYRGMLGFRPQGPTTAQLNTAAGTAVVGGGAGIGSRLSGRAHDAVVTGNGISVTLKNASVHRGRFNFDNKLNRHDEWGMITALTSPIARLVLA